jgi:hypothetical protein
MIKKKLTAHSTGKAAGELSPHFHSSWLFGERNFTKMYIYTLSLAL